MYGFLSCHHGGRDAYDASHRNADQWRTTVLWPNIIIQRNILMNRRRCLQRLIYHRISMIGGFNRRQSLCFQSLACFQILPLPVLPRAMVGTASSFGQIISCNYTQPLLLLFFLKYVSLALCACQFSVIPASGSHYVRRHAHPWPFHRMPHPLYLVYFTSLTPVASSFGNRAGDVISNSTSSARLSVILTEYGNHIISCVQHDDIEQYLPSCSIIHTLLAPVNFWWPALSYSSR